MLNTRKSQLSAQGLSASSHFEDLLNSFRWFLPSGGGGSSPGRSRWGRNRIKTCQSPKDYPQSPGKTRKFERKKGRSKVLSGVSVGESRFAWQDCGSLPNLKGTESPKNDGAATLVGGAFCSQTLKPAGSLFLPLPLLASKVGNSMIKTLSLSS